MEENTEVQRYKNEAEDGIYFVMPRESARSQQVSHQGYGKPSCMTVPASLTLGAKKKKRIHVTGKGPSPATNRKKMRLTALRRNIKNRGVGGHAERQCANEEFERMLFRAGDFQIVIQLRSSDHLGHSVQVTDMTQHDKEVGVHDT